MRRVLFDENMPRKLRRDLPDLFIRTIQEEGWTGLENGTLLRRTSGTFDVLVTADQRLRHQQNVSQFGIGIVVIETWDTTLASLRRFLPKLKIAIDEVAAGAVVVLNTP
ncbi:MAG: hypothetical protein AABO58_01605 [Acidobacteriota bacterium]